MRKWKASKQPWGRFLVNGKHNISPTAFVADRDGASRVQYAQSNASRFQHVRMILHYIQCIITLMMIIYGHDPYSPLFCCPAKTSASNVPRVPYKRGLCRVASKEVLLLAPYRPPRRTDSPRPNTLRKVPSTFCNRKP